MLKCYIRAAERIAYLISKYWEYLKFGLGDNYVLVLPP